MRLNFTVKYCNFFLMAFFFVFLIRIILSRNDQETSSVKTSVCMQKTQYPKTKGGINSWKRIVNMTQSFIRKQQQHRSVLPLRHRVQAIKKTKSVAADPLSRRKRRYCFSFSISSNFAIFAFIAASSARSSASVASSLSRSPAAFAEETRSRGGCALPVLPCTTPA